MAADAHFGCPKFTFDRISGHFRSIRNFNYFWNFLPNGYRRPFWISEINFRWHFWPFQINTKSLWMSEIHFQSHFWPFQIDTQLYFFFEIFDKMAAVGHFGCPKFTFDSIFGHFRSILNHFGCPIFTLIAFWSFQIDTQLFFFLTNRPFWMGRQYQLTNSSEIFGWIMHVSSLKNVV